LTEASLAFSSTFVVALTFFSLKTSLELAPAQWDESRVKMKSLFVCLFAASKQQRSTLFTTRYAPDIHGNDL
jgi:hypothetical protein